MIAALALTLAVAAHAAPAVPAFETSLINIHTEVLAATARLATQEQLKKADKNVVLTANQAYSNRSFLASLRAQARTSPRDPSLFGQLANLASDLDVWASNCEVVRKQVMDLARTAAKDPALAALAKKLYDHSRILDSDAGYLLIEARSADVDLSIAGYGGQAYQIQRLAEAGAALTPDTRVAAKTVLDKIGAK
ncbi:MAG TPA: hypothetical protein VN915_01375 [Elusimicrobiota bacterium]|nr:hypothetical protein [Elusimicrobiota bacterium]